MVHSNMLHYLVEGLSKEVSELVNIVLQRPVEC